MSGWWKFVIVEKGEIFEWKMNSGEGTGNFFQSIKWVLEGK